MQAFCNTHTDFLIERTITYLLTYLLTYLHTYVLTYLLIYLRKDEQNIAFYKGVFGFIHFLYT